jgi:hypothetical protein
MRSSKVERAIPNRFVELVVRVRAAPLNYRGRLVIEGTFIPDLTLPFVPHRMLLVRSRVRTPLAFEWANREYDAR